MFIFQTSKTLFPTVYARSVRYVTRGVGPGGYLEGPDNSFLPSSTLGGSTLEGNSRCKRQKIW